MIEPEKISDVHADEGVMYNFGDLGYVSVYADGHVRFVIYAPRPGMEITHAVNGSAVPENMF